MTALSVIFDIILILISIALIVAVLMQQGQRQGLGAIGGGAETFFGKNKARSLDGKLQAITRYATIAFVVLALVATIVTSKKVANDQAAAQAALQEMLNSTAAEEVTDAVEGAAEETADAVEGAAEEAAEAVEGAAEEAAAAVEGAAEEAADAVEGAAEEAAAAVEGAVEEAAETVEEAAK